VYKGIQGGLEYTGYTRVYRIYKGAQGIQGYTGYTKVHRVYKGNRLTGEKCLRRRRAKNHVVGFRECYWFSGVSR